MLSTNFLVASRISSYVSRNDKKRNERIAEKKFLQKLTRENLSNTCQLGWKASMGYAGNRRIPLAHHFLYLFGYFRSGHVIGQCGHVQMDHRCSYRSTGREYLPGSHNSSLILPAGYGDKTCISLDFGKINMRISIRMQIRCPTPNDVFMERSREMAHSDLLTRISSDASEVLGMGMGILPNLLVTGLQLASSFIYLWILDARLAWFILGVTPLVLLSKIYFRKVRELSCAQKKMNSEMGTVMQENLSKRILVRSLGATNYRKQKLHETQEKLFKLGMEQIEFSTFTQGSWDLHLEEGTYVHPLGISNCITTR